MCLICPSEDLALRSLNGSTRSTVLLTWGTGLQHPVSDVCGLLRGHYAVHSVTETKEAELGFLRHQLSYMCLFTL